MIERSFCWWPSVALYVHAYTISAGLARSPWLSVSLSLSLHLSRSLFASLWHSLTLSLSLSLCLDSYFFVILSVSLLSVSL